MKGNQGLEALAALCGGQSDAPTDDSRRSNNRGSKSAETSAASRTSSSNGQQAQATQDSALQQALRQTPLSSQQSPLQNVTQQQWQQAIAAAAALQGGGVNPALAAQSFLLSGLSPQQSLGDSHFSAMQQQLSFHQFIQAQAKLTAQQAALTGAGKAGAFGESPQALMMALAAGKAQQLQGKLFFSFESMFL